MQLFFWGGGRGQTRDYVRCTNGEFRSFWVARSLKPPKIPEIKQFPVFWPLPSNITRLGEKRSTRVTGYPRILLNQERRRIATLSSFNLLLPHPILTTWTGCRFVTGFPPALCFRYPFINQGREELSIVFKETMRCSPEFQIWTPNV